MKSLFSISFVLQLVITLFIQSAYTQSHQRRADWQAQIQAPDGALPGAVVQSVVDGSPLQQAGIRPDDRIIKINGKLIRDSNQWSDIRFQARAGKPIELLVKRNGSFETVEVTLNPLPREQFDNIEISYETVLSDYGHKLRAILSRPENTTGKLPGIFVIQGLSCNSIELHPGRALRGWTRLLNDLVTESEMVVMRIEKPGVGDSEGACSETDLNTEMAAYRAGIEYLFDHPWLDPSRVVLFGSSAGSTLAPLFANEFDVAGIIADGTFAKTWFEHMLEIERRLQAFQGASPSEIARRMNEGYIPLYYGMLIEKKSYGEVIHEQPGLAAYNYHSPRHMYGRSVEYYQQLQNLDIAGAWAALKDPARIRWGTNDWIMSEEDNGIIIDILEESGHEDHELLKFPGMDHFNMMHENPEASFSREPGRWDPRISGQIIEWAWEMVNE